VSARPGDWHLLGADGDPLPGDAYDVASEARHYDQTATAIRDQVSRLRQMASGNNELVGKYAPALEDAAKDLADHLDDAQGRFDTVASQLKIWSPVLSDGMSQTLSMVREAEQAQSTIDANQPSGTPVDKKDDHAVQADQQRGNRLSGAQGDLSGIQGRFDTLMGHVNDTAEDVAKKISDASHDSLKDSWWDSHVRKWIHDHADLLKMIADVLTWIATAIIIVVLIVGTGGVGLAILLTAGALLIHTMLAANGDGSWVDVGIDAFALVTLGAGRMLSTAAKTARLASLAEAAPGAADAAFTETATMGRIFVAGEDGIEATTGITNLSEAGNAFTKTWNAVATREIPEVSNMIKLTFGDAGELTNDLLKIGTQFGDSPLIQQGLRAANQSTNLYRAGMSVDVLGKIFNDSHPFAFDYSGVKSWVDWKEQHTVAPVPGQDHLP
jgi:hypothetical protein